MDVCPQIKQCASIALGRLVHSDAVMAEQLLDAGLLNLLLRNAGTGNVRISCKFNSKNILKFLLNDLEISENSGSICVALYL